MLRASTSLSPKATFPLCTNLLLSLGVSWPPSGQMDIRSPNVVFGARLSLQARLFESIPKAFESIPFPQLWQDALMFNINKAEITETIIMKAMPQLQILLPRVLTVHLLPLAWDTWLSFAAWASCFALLPKTLGMIYITSFSNAPVNPLQMRNVLLGFCHTNTKTNVSKSLKKSLPPHEALPFCPFRGGGAKWQSFFEKILGSDLKRSTGRATSIDWEKFPVHAV